MTDREKLVELLYGLSIDTKEDAEYVADHLISNGVTVQEWIPLTKEKPGRYERVLVFFEGMRGTPAETQIMCGWCIDGSATHWQPLPEPPKEE